MELNLSSDTHRPSDQHRVSIPVYEIEENEVRDRGNINIIKFCLFVIVYSNLGATRMCLEVEFVGKK